MDSHCFKLHRSYLISFNLSNVGEIFWVESERTVSKFRKRKRKFLCCDHLLDKVGEWNCTKKRDARAKVFFCQSKPISFLLLQKLPIVMIQKFCYHNNVTSHFSSLVRSSIPLSRPKFSLNPVTPTVIFSIPQNTTSQVKGRQFTEVKITQRIFRFKTCTYLAMYRYRWSKR